MRMRMRMIIITFVGGRYYLVFFAREKIMNVLNIQNKPLTNRNFQLQNFSEENRVSAELDTFITNIYGEVIAFRGFGQENSRERNLYISTKGFDAVLRACRGIKEIIIRREQSNIGQQKDLCELIINGWCGLYLNFNMVSINAARSFIEELLSTTFNRFEYSVKITDSSRPFNSKESNFDECFFFPMSKRGSDNNEQETPVIHVYPYVDIDELRHATFYPEIINLIPDNLLKDG